MKPRQILKGKTYMITRKTAHGMFLLRPSVLVNACIRYCVAIAQERAKVKLHSLVFLSNHYHIILTDPFGRLPEFTEELNKLIARSLNRHHGRSENFWKSGTQTSQVELVDEESVLQKTVYVLANPVAAHLVSSGKDWPGVRLFRHGTLKAPKPTFFFRSEENGGPLPDVAQLKLTPAPIGVQRQLVDDVVLKETRAREKKLRLEAKRSKRSFLGEARVRKQPIYATPKAQTSDDTESEISPRVAGSDSAARAAAIKRLETFVREHRCQLEEFKGGKRETVFPLGTYKMARMYGVSCASASA